jgi:hypothetical protein
VAAHVPNASHALDEPSGATRRLPSRRRPTTADDLNHHEQQSWPGLGLDGLGFYESRTLMERTIDVPLQLVEDVATLRLPEMADLHLQQLMDRNSEGLLSDQELTGLAALVELSERLSLVRAEALHLLGRKALVAGPCCLVP